MFYDFDQRVTRRIQSAYQDHISTMHSQAAGGFRARYNTIYRALVLGSQGEPEFFSAGYADTNSWPRHFLERQGPTLLQAIKAFSTWNTIRVLISGMEGYDDRFSFTYDGVTAAFVEGGTSSDFDRFDVMRRPDSWPTLQEGGPRGGIVYETVNRTTVATLDEEGMASLPSGARQYASRSLPAQSMILRLHEDDRFERVAGGTISAEQLRQEALDVYRITVRARVASNRLAEEAEERRVRAAHRQRSAENFTRFMQQRERVTEQVVGTLPFVPHGLASSRRWGIEVESGGARDVEAPTNWDRVSDGSLRSAYDGYVEVQDFEPHEEERSFRRTWRDCADADRHLPYVEVYDDGRREYLMLMREDYINPRECPNCGIGTETVWVEPQTIHHQAQNGDCAEFVSPILTSMHSNGLEQLTKELSQRPQNASAGVHVHVEASDLSEAQIATLVYGYGLMEPILEASYRRERRNYCRERSVDEVLHAARAVSDGGLNPRDTERYVTLNLQSLSRHGTLEFRAMGPVYEYDYLVRWAMLCRELVNTVANGATRKDFAQINTWQDILSLLARFGKEYIRATVYEMTGEVGEAARLEKEGVNVTTEALNADLASAWERLSGLLANAGSTVEDFGRRLVGVAAGASET